MPSISPSSFSHLDALRLQALSFRHLAMFDARAVGLLFSFSFSGVQAHPSSLCLLQTGLGDFFSIVGVSGLVRGHPLLFFSYLKETKSVPLSKETIPGGEQDVRSPLLTPITDFPFSSESASFFLERARLRVYSNSDSSFDAFIFIDSMG